MVRTVELTSKVILKVEDIGLFASLVLLIACLMYQLHIVMCLATHYDVFLREKNDIWSHPHTPFLYGVPGNLEERSNITEPRCFQPGFPDVMVFAGPDQFVMISCWENNTGSDQPNLMISQVWIVVLQIPDLLKSLKWKLRAFGWFIVEQKTTSVALYIDKRNQSAYVFFQGDLTYHTVTHRIHVGYLFLHVVDFYGT